MAWKFVVAVLFLLISAIGVAVQDHQSMGQPDTLAAGPLIPASTAMETAWDIPHNPLTDSLPKNPQLAAQIKRGYEIFINTPDKGKRFTGNNLSCNNCHLNGGQREKAMPLVGVAGVFPEYNKRSGRLFSLEDRIVGCFERSEHASGARKNNAKYLLPYSDEVLALSAYITWLSSGYPIGKILPWRGQNIIVQDKLIPINQLDPHRGMELFKEKCSTCHGEDGQGVAVGDKKPGPLWGPKSWNDGAGAARIYTLAGIIRYAMPYLDPGSLTDEEAQQIAAFINSKPRPVYLEKRKDYPTEPVPADAVYYHRASK